MSSQFFEEVNEEVVRGLNDLNCGLSMGFDRLNKYIGIRKRVMSLIFGAPGSGKSAFMHSAYILNPFESIKRDNINVKFKVILFSMERSRIYIIAKWISRKIFLDEQVLIPIPKLLGWWKKEKLTKDEHDLFLSCKDYIDELEEYVDIIQGPQNPTGIFEYVKSYSKTTGYMEEIDEYNKVYMPKSGFENQIVIVAQDHLGLTKLERGCNNKKEAIDKLVEYNQIIRDRYSFIPVLVSQLNRNLSNPMFQNMSHVEPTLDEVKESGAPGEASDVVLSLFDPRRYRTTDSAYKVEKFVCKATGGNYFRNTKILKNTYGEDSISVGMGFHGATGIFKELPKPFKDKNGNSNMDNFDYDSIFDGSYFLRNE